MNPLQFLLSAILVALSIGAIGWVFKHYPVWGCVCVGIIILIGVCVYKAPNMPDDYED